MHTLITSFDKDGYEKYGKGFLEGLKHWPEDIRVVVYYEGGADIDGAFSTRVEVKNFWEVEHMREWFDKISNFALMSGKTDDVEYNINFDARQVRKVFMEAHALKTYGGKVFWIDADIVTHSPVPKPFLNYLLPHDKFCCYLGRDWFYTESGFIGFNADHQMYKDFINAYTKIFLDGVIFTRPGWHDCWGFDVVREWSSDPHVFVDLVRGLPHTLHPFVNSVLGKYMDHLKGGRKGGKTDVKDLIVPRPEAYWNECH